MQTNFRHNWASESFQVFGKLCMLVLKIIIIIIKSIETNSLTKKQIPKEDAYDTPASCVHKV
jgi:hypothetical protein